MGLWLVSFVDSPNPAPKLPMSALFTRFALTVLLARFHRFRFSGLRGIGRLAALGFATIATGAIADPGAPRFRLVGAATIDITPDYPVRQSGYGSRTNVHTGVAQHIFANALAIGGDSEGLALIVTVDNCGVPATLRDELIRRLGRKTTIRGERFTIASTHTHCAPMLSGVLPNLFGADIPAEHLPAIERYTRELTDKIESVCLAAIAARRPATLSWGVGTVDFAANRRNYRLKPVDHSLPLLKAVDRDGKVIAILTSYACHCTTLDIDQIHGDWAGSAHEALQQAFPGAVALIAIGCGADQNPAPRRTLELASRHGQALATEAARLARTPLTPIEGDLVCRTQEIELAFDTLPSRNDWEKLAQSATRAIAYHARKNLARLDRGEPLPTRLPYLVQTWTFGENLALVFLPGEVVVDYALRLKTEFDPRRLWVNAYANDVPCYIPSRRILDEGGYEGGGAMVYYDRPTRFAPDVEDRIIGAVHELMPAGFLPRQQLDPMASAPPAVAYSDHSQLLLVKDPRGVERPVTTREDWSARTAHVRANLQQVMGPLPDTARWSPLNVEIRSEQTLAHYRRRKIRFSPERGDRVPAWLLIPTNLPPSGRAPAMLCLHQTTPIGKDEPAGLGGLDSLHYAHELAERGYVCLIPDYPSFGEYPFDFKKQAAHYASGTMKAIWNNQRAIDLLEATPEVDKDHIGVIGHSLGGHNALFTAVFDERLKAVISSCGFTPFHDYYGGKLAGWTSDRYMPRIRDIYHNNPDEVPFDFTEIIAALAPRAFFSNSPLHDSNFDIAGVRKAFAAVEPVYSLFGATNRLSLVTPDAPHDFPQSVRQAAYDWLDTILK
jgi:dienelactone hydrolase